jgi:chitin synthase
LSDYFNTVSLYGDASGEGVPKYDFLNSDITALIKQQPGQDLTKDIKQILDTMSTEDAQAQLTCLKNVFYIGDTDFRKEARCTVQNWLLLSFSIIMMSTVAAKCTPLSISWNPYDIALTICLSLVLAALQLGSKRQPELQDKFVLCQVPCYTEGEESLRRTIDTLAALNYDDKRKLIFIICDGNIIGSGNDRPTPRIVLDILGVDPKLDPEPLLFKSIGEGSRQLNYGKVYSGLYEFEGHVVP